LRDRSGRDQLDFSAQQAPLAINLVPGPGAEASAGATRTLNFAAVIENAVGGSGDDTIAGSDGSNLLIGNGGGDQLFGNRGADELRGDAGNDLVQSNGDGDKTLIGGEGNDTINGAGVVDTVFGGPGTDIVKTFGGDDVIHAADDVAGGDDVDCGAGSGDVAEVDSGDTYVNCEILVF
jgi:hypothetical protein